MAPIEGTLVVLRTYPYGDSSSIVRALSPEHGLISLIAKGARRPKSRIGALLEVFTSGEALVYPSRSGDLHTLASFSAGRSRQAIGHDLARFSGASLLAEIVLRAGTAEPSAELFVVLDTALGDLTVGNADALEVSIGSGWKLLGVLGFAPRTDSCIRCASSLSGDAQCTFDPAGGGVTCVGCRPGRRVVHPELRGHLTDTLATPPGRYPRVGAGDRLAYRDLFVAYARHQLEDARPLRSVPMVESMMT